MTGEKSFLRIIGCFLCLMIFISGIVHARENTPVTDSSSISVTINFHTKSKVENETVTVGDIASVICTDSSVCEKIKSIYVTTLSSPDATVSLNADQIAEILRKNLPSMRVALNQVKGTLPEEIVITRIRGNKARKLFAKIYRDYVFKHMPWNQADVTITSIKVSRSNFVPGKNGVTYRVMADPGASFLGNTPVTVVLFKDRERIGSVRIIGKINVFKEVARAARNIASHEVLRKTDFRFVRENLADLSRDVITDPRQVIGKEAVHSFRVNEIIRKRDVAAPLLVQKGDIVTILISAPGLLITSKGQALEGGRLGEMMRVKNIATKRVVIGMVKGQKTVQVAF